MATIPVNLERKALKQMVITIHVRQRVNIPFKIGVLLIRLGVWVAGVTYGGIVSHQE